MAFAERFRPHFVVVSVFPNDFGDGLAVLRGEGDWFRRPSTGSTRFSSGAMDTMPCVCSRRCLAITSSSASAETAGTPPISEFFRGVGLTYCDGLDQFVDEHLRLRREGDAQGRQYATSGLSTMARSPTTIFRIGDPRLSGAGSSPGGLHCCCPLRPRKAHHSRT